jgi:phage FluMu protein Com
MDATRCPHCTKRMKAGIAENGRTEFSCLRCDQVNPLQTNAVKWAEGPPGSSVDDLAAPSLQ